MKKVENECDGDIVKLEFGVGIIPYGSVIKQVYLHWVEF